MTRLLDITNGEYVKFMSSFEYDTINNTTFGTFVEEFEQSFAYKDLFRTIEKQITYYLTMSPKYRNYTRENFEIIYD